MKRKRSERPERHGPNGSSAAIAFGVLLASYAINAMDRQLFPLLAPEVRREYGFSLEAIGFLSTVFTLGMAGAGVVTGYLLTRFSRKTVLQIGIAVFSAGTALTVLSSGFFDMLVYRAATGIGEAMQLTVLLAIAVSYFASRRGAAVGAINFFFAVGAIIGPAAGRRAHQHVSELAGADGGVRVPRLRRDGVGRRRGQAMVQRGARRARRHDRSRRSR